MNLQKEFVVSVLEYIKEYKNINVYVERFLQHIFYEISDFNDELINVVIKEIGNNKISIEESDIFGVSIIYIVSNNGTKKELARAQNGRLISLFLYETTQIGDCFFRYVNNLRKFKAFKLRVMGNNCFSLGDADSALDVELPELEKMGSFCFGTSFYGKELFLPNLISMGNSCFYSPLRLESINLPKLEMMGKSCFYSPVKLKALEIPNLNDMWDNCFGGDVSNLENIKLNTVQRIGSGCFPKCKNLISVYAPNLQIIGNETFGILKKLEKTKLKIVQDTPKCIKNLLLRPETMTNKIKNVVLKVKTRIKGKIK